MVCTTSCVKYLFAIFVENCKFDILLYCIQLELKWICRVTFACTCMYNLGLQWVSSYPVTVRFLEVSRFQNCISDNHNHCFLCVCQVSSELQYASCKFYFVTSMNELTFGSVQTCQNFFKLLNKLKQCYKYLKFITMFSQT